MAELKTYKVIALSVGGRGKRIFNSGDKVTENDFIPGVADQLVDRGYLQPLKEKIEGPENDYKSDEREVEFKRDDDLYAPKNQKPKGKNKK